jgi:hypothetical protein
MNITFNLERFDSVVVTTQYGEVVVERTGRGAFATFSAEPEIYAFASTPESAFMQLGEKLRVQKGEVIVAEEYVC